MVAIARYYFYSGTAAGAPLLNLTKSGSDAIYKVAVAHLWQQFIINWWRWRCGVSKNSTGSNWIPVEHSSEANVFLFWKLLAKRRYLQFFPLLANFYWKLSLCLGLPAATRGANCPLLQAKCKTRAPTYLIAHFRFSIPLVFSSFTGILKNFSVISCFSIAIHTRTHHQLRTQKIFMAGFHSVAYGGRLYLVCTVCDVTIWRHFHVSKPTLWRSLLT